MTDFLGNNLIFLISQPRAGSTLLQRILGSHSDIHTVAEPWVMLHPLYALRDKGYEAEYNAQVSRSALVNFVDGLPGGRECHVVGVRRMCSYLYDQALVGSGKRLFLDKTPRYYLIIPELCQVFPSAHYIILLRNPLAVLCSIIDTWVKGDWLKLYNYKYDLLDAPSLLNDAIQRVPNLLVVHYEQLVNDSHTEVNRLCDYLGISFESTMINYGRTDSPQWSLGDMTSIYKYSQPVTSKVDKWVKAIENPQIWRLAHDYLHLLGGETCQKLGYSYQELEDILESRRPSKFALLGTWSLKYLLSKPLERRGVLPRLIRAIKRRGMLALTDAVVRRTRSALSSTR